MAILKNTDPLRLALITATVTQQDNETINHLLSCNPDLESKFDHIESRFDADHIRKKASCLTASLAPPNNPFELMIKSFGSQNFDAMLNMVRKNSHLLKPVSVSNLIDIQQDNDNRFLSLQKCLITSMLLGAYRLAPRDFAERRVVELLRDVHVDYSNPINSVGILEYHGLCALSHSCNVYLYKGFLINIAKAFLDNGYSIEEVFQSKDGRFNFLSNAAEKIKSSCVENNSNNKKTYVKVMIDLIVELIDLGANPDLPGYHGKSAIAILDEIDLYAVGLDGREISSKVIAAGLKGSNERQPKRVYI